MLDTVRKLNLEDYVEEDLLAGSFDSLDSHIARKKLIANKSRYAIVYVLNDCKQLTFQELDECTDIPTDELRTHLNELADVNLITWVPSPQKSDKDDIYRITRLGEQEIQSDIENVNGPD